MKHKIESGETIERDGGDLAAFWEDEDEHLAQDRIGEFIDGLLADREFVTQVVFFLNITKVGENACSCSWADNLVIVEIPEGVLSIGWSAFDCCSRLAKISFPRTLTSIGRADFGRCLSLENVDLLHTNLQELGQQAFDNCPQLKSMTIPDSLQGLGGFVFHLCPKLVPSNIIVNDTTIDSTPEVVSHLRSSPATTSSTLTTSVG